MSIKEYKTSKKKFQWIDITAPTEVELSEIGEKFNIHRYSIKDCLEPDHLPKLEFHQNYKFIISRIMLENNQLKDKANSVQQATSKVAIFYCDNFLITIHRLPLDLIDIVFEKYVINHPEILTDDIVVKILWYVTNSYEKPAIKLADELDIYEEKIFLKSLSPDLLKNLYFIKRQTHIATKLFQFMQSVINNIQASDSSSLNDLKDYHLKLQSIYNQNYEDVTSLMNFYLSLSAQKTNEVMRILTVFSAFFLPLTFIAGVYGMNFDFLPELHIREAYPAFWIVCIVITIIIFQWFWRKKWL